MSTVLLVASCSIPGNPAHLTNPVTLAQEVQFGSQTWMARNLDVINFRNGDPIPQAISNEAWKAAGKQGKPAWCYYNNDSTTRSKYGRMYNWYAVNDSRGLAPQGWHIPSNQEWIALEEFVGLANAGSRLKCDSASGNTHDDRSPDFLRYAWRIPWPQWKIHRYGGIHLFVRHHPGHIIEFKGR